jgi:hypothetical protein
MEKHFVILPLTVHKCEIFDLVVDSCDFDNIKPLWVGDFGAVIVFVNLKNFNKDFIGEKFC